MIHRYWHTVLFCVWGPLSWYVGLTQARPNYKPALLAHVAGLWSKKQNRWVKAYWCYWGEPEQAPHWSWQRPICWEYLCIITRICRTHVSEIHARPERSMYSGILMCFMSVITKTLEQQGFELLIVCHEDCKRSWCVHIHNYCISDKYLELLHVR